MSEANKRIPVREETHEMLHDLKTPGQTYDDLMKALIQERHRKDLAEKFRQMDEMDTDDFVPLDDV